MKKLMTTIMVVWLVSLVGTLAISFKGEPSQQMIAIESSQS